MPDIHPALPPGSAKTPEEIVALWRAFVRGRRAGGRIVGKGAMLYLPVEIDVQPVAGGAFQITLSDQEGHRTTFEAAAASRSKYRKQVEFVSVSGDGSLRFRGFAHLGPMHAEILDSVRPGKCVSKEEYDRITGRVRRRGSRTQTDGGRRWRELKGEYGFDLEVRNGEYCRRSELPVEEPRLRPETGRLTREMLPRLLASGAELECAKCGTKVAFEGYEHDPGAVDGVIDHRRPVAYGGSDAEDNLQILCVRCNNLKRNYCERCPLGYRCERCSWAFPERINDLLVIALSPAEAEALEKLVERYKGKPPEVAKRLLAESLEKHLRKG